MRVPVSTVAGVSLSFPETIVSERHLVAYSISDIGLQYYFILFMLLLDNDTFKYPRQSLFEEIWRRTIPLPPFRYKPVPKRM